MSSRGVRVRVWCEGRRDETFVRRLLTDVFGLNPRAIDVEPAPAGQGAASDWVVRRYHDFVAPEYRRIRHQANLGFMIVVDGDNLGFKSRLAALQADRRAADDRIALLAPTWSIETWILWLNGERVSEAEQTKDRLPAGEFQQKLKAALTRWKASANEQSPPSLSSAHEELRRLPMTS